MTPPKETKAPQQAPSKDIHIKLGSWEITLPSWWKHGAGVVALAVLSMWAWLNYGVQVFHEGEIYLAIYEHTQMEEAMRHFFEEPTDRWEMEEDAGRAKFFESDRCTAILWQYDDKNPNTGSDGEVVQFVLHPSRTFEIDEISRGDRLFAAPVFAADVSCSHDRCTGSDVCSDNYPDGNHPGRFHAWSEPDEDGDDCTEWVYYRFEDCCQTRRTVNRCDLELATEVEWICCTH